MAALHSFVGIAASIVGFSRVIYSFSEEELTGIELLEAFFGIFIGNVTFTGSIVAFGKLQGYLRSAPLLIGG